MIMYIAGVLYEIYLFPHNMTTGMANSTVRNRSLAVARSMYIQPRAHQAPVTGVQELPAPVRPRDSPPTCVELAERAVLFAY